MSQLKRILTEALIKLDKRIKVTSSVLYVFCDDFKNILAKEETRHGNINLTFSPWYRDKLLVMDSQIKMDGFIDILYESNIPEGHRVMNLLELLEKVKSEYEIDLVKLEI